MEKLISILFILVFISACSKSDKGVNFSENYQKSLGQVSQKVVSTGCSLEGVSVAPSVKKYDVQTESIITELFTKYVTPLQAQDSYQLSGKVKYFDWLINQDDKVKLCEVIQEFNNTDSANFNRKQKMSFYINAYNIFTIELILRNYLKIDKGETRDQLIFPYRKSIRNINDFDDKVWDNFAWKVGNQNLSLNEIEKGILIPMGDARVHFAVNCASLGCPPLRNEAFTASKLDEQLDEMSTFFVSSPAYNSIELLDDVYDPVDGDNFYEISQIFDWYQADFENDISGRYGSVQKFITYHLNKTDADLGFPKKDIENIDIWFEEFGRYDWELNEEIN